MKWIMEVFKDRNFEVVVVVTREKCKTLWISTCTNLHGVTFQKILIFRGGIYHHEIILVFLQLHDR